METSVSTPAINISTSHGLRNESKSLVLGCGTTFRWKSALGATVLFQRLVPNYIIPSQVIRSATFFVQFSKIQHIRVSIRGAQSPVAYALTKSDLGIIRAA